MEIVKPISRLLLACALLILIPIYLGVTGRPLYWLLPLCAGLTFISCSLQGYRRAALIAGCGASNLAALAVVYTLACVSKLVL